MTSTMSTAGTTMLGLLSGVCLAKQISGVQLATTFFLQVGQSVPGILPESRGQHPGRGGKAAWAAGILP